MSTSLDSASLCQDCKYSDDDRQVNFVDEDVYPERIRRCPHCIVFPDAQEMDREPFQDCCGPLSMFYGMCMDCIDDLAEHMLRECDLCQFIWKSLRIIRPLERVCKPCFPLHNLYQDVWLLYGPVGGETLVEPGPDCQICYEKRMHQFLYAMFQAGRARMCWPCLRVFRHPL